MDNEVFEINDLVEVPKWTMPVGKNWVIAGFTDDGKEACLRRWNDNDEQIFVPLSDLKHQEEDTKPEQKFPFDIPFPSLRQALRQEILLWILNRLEKGLEDANFDDNVGCIKRLIDEVRKEADLPPRILNK